MAQQAAQHDDTLQLADDYLQEVFIWQYLANADLEAYACVLQLTITKTVNQQGLRSSWWCVQSVSASAPNVATVCDITLEYATHGFGGDSVNFELAERYRCRGMQHTANPHMHETLQAHSSQAPQQLPSSILCISKYATWTHTTCSSTQIRQ